MTSTHPCFYNPVTFPWTEGGTEPTLGVLWSLCSCHRFTAKWCKASQDRHYMQWDETCSDSLLSSILWACTLNAPALTRRWGKNISIILLISWFHWIHGTNSSCVQRHFFSSKTNVTIIHNFGILVIDQFLHVSHSVVQAVKVDPQVVGVMLIKHFVKSCENGKTFQV